MVKEREGREIPIPTWVGRDGTVIEGFENYFYQTIPVSDTVNPVIEIAEELNHVGRGGYIINDTGGPLDISFNDVGGSGKVRANASETTTINPDWKFVIRRIQLFGVNAGVTLNVRVFII